MATSLEQFKKTVEHTLTIATLAGDEEETLIPSLESPNTDVRELVAQLPQMQTQPGGEARQDLEMRGTLGSGAMGVVHLAEQRSLGREVAVKSLRPDDHDAHAALSLLREAWVTGWLEHPSVIPIYTLGVDRLGRPMIVMKRIEGTPWTAYLRGKASPASIEPGETLLEWNLRVLMQVAGAVQFANSRGLVHRDLKPDNVMVGRFGEVYVLDWGIAVSLHEDANGRLPMARDARGIAGTPGYMAPEMIDEACPKIAITTDVYLLGAILHEVLTGTHRHRGGSLLETLFSSSKSAPYEYASSVPAELGAIANKATAERPEDRYPDAEKFRNAIAEFLRHEGARQIAAEARKRLTSLRTLVDGAGSSAGSEDGDAAVAIYKLYGECRFGFMHALQAWPEGQDARRGLEDCLRVMLEYELRQSNYRAAAAIAAELPALSPEISARLEALRARTAEQSRALEKLEAIEADRSLEIGRNTRALLSVLIAVVWALAPLSSGLALYVYHFRPTFTHYFMQVGTIVALSLWWTWSARHALTRTAVNRVIVVSMYLMGLGVVLTKVAGMAVGISLEQALIFDNIVFSVLFLAMATATDRRLVASGIIYLLGFLASCAWQPQLYFIGAATHFFAFLVVALIWMPRRWSGIAGAVLLALLLPETGAFAQLRHVAIIEEYVDDRPQPKSAVEDALVGELARAGVNLVDPQQSRRLRGLAGTGKQLLEGGVPASVSTLDADVILAGLARAVKIQSGLLGSSVSAYEITAQLRMIAVDSGQIMATLSERGTGRELTRESAVARAAEEVAKKLARGVLENLHRAGGRSFQLLVSTELPLGVSTIEPLRRAVERIPGVSEARVVQQDASGVTLEVSPQASGAALAARDLALALDAAQGLGLFVFGYSDRVIKARYSAARVSKIPVLIGEFRGPTKARGPMIAGVVGAALARAEILSLSNENKGLILQGSWRAEGSNLEVEARLVTARGGKLVESERVTCLEGQLSACLDELGEKLGASAFPAIQERTQLLASTAAVPRVRSDKPLEFAAINLDDIFPAQASRYFQRGVGRVRLRNTGTERATKGVLSASLLGYSSAPAEVPIPELDPGQEVELDAKLILDAAALSDHRESRYAALQLELEYSAGGFRVADRRSTALVVHHPNAIRWKDELSVAAFVTPRAPAIERLAAAADQAIAPGLRSSPFAVPAALFASLNGLAYAADTAHPFGAQDLDDVQFPAETLVRGRGDCDDLAVLYAALAEAAGVPALLVTTPGHVFAALETGVPVESAGELSLDADRLLFRRGAVWIPVETTEVGRSFEDAWARAAGELAALRRSGGAPGVVELREAWRVYGPAELAPAQALPENLPKLAAAQLEREVRDLEVQRVRELDARVRAIGPGGAGENEKGVLYARFGELERARQSFRAAERAGFDPLVVRNNQANVALLAGQAKDALSEYEAVLERASRRTEVRLNALLAAVLANDPEKVAEHALHCPDDAVRGLFEQLDASQTGRGTESPRARASVAQLIHWL